MSSGFPSGGAVARPRLEEEVSPLVPPPVPGPIEAGASISSGCAEGGDPACFFFVPTMRPGAPEINIYPGQEEAAAGCCLVCEPEPGSRARCSLGALPPLTRDIAVLHSRHRLFLHSRANSSAQLPNSPWVSPHFTFLFH